MRKKTMFRVCKDKDNPYVMLNKKFLNDTKLSWKAKGILAYLLSLPDDWQVYEDEIVKHSADGRDSTRSGIKELTDRGYIDRERIRDEKGMMRGYNYSVYEVPDHIGKPDNGESNTTNNDLTNKKDIYIALPGDAHIFIPIYKQYFKEYLGKEHMRVTKKQLSYVEECLGELTEAGITEEEFEEKVREHFETLPESNNGNIIAFLSCMMRYFGIYNPHDL